MSESELEFWVDRSEGGTLGQTVWLQVLSLCDLRGVDSPSLCLSHLEKGDTIQVFPKVATAGASNPTRPLQCDFPISPSRRGCLLPACVPLICLDQ